jgi:uncharacterized protein (TIGR03067 family)
MLDLTVRAVGGCASPTVVALVQGAFPMVNLARKSLAWVVAFLALAGACYGVWRAVPRAPAESSARLDREPDPASELEGEWLVVESHSAERKEPSFKVRSYQCRCTFAGNELRQAAQKDRYEQRMTFRLDPTRSPKWIDLTVQTKDGSHADVPGIYAVENGRLRLCVNWRESGKRPKGFDSASEEGMVTWELVRLPLAKAGPADELGQVLLEWEQAERAGEEAPDRAVQRDEAASLADRCLRIADEDDGPTGLAALCWAALTAPGSDAGKKALALLGGGRVARASLEDLSEALEDRSVDDAEVAEKMGRLVLDRVKSDLAHPRCPQLLCWVAVLTWWLDYETAPAYFTQAADLIAAHFADSPDVYHFCEALARPGVTPPAWAAGFEAHLRGITKKNRHRHVRAFAQYALAAVIQLGGEARQAEAVAEYRRFLDQFDGTDPVWGSEKSMRKACELELERLGRLGLGKKAPPIDRVDLDGKPMKLSDFDGNVVLLSFWGEWCGACMKAIPHERDLVARYKDRPFALVGVNSDPLGTDLRATVERHRITWRSFEDKQPDRKRIAADYAVRGWPSFYLIDHKGVIRGRWVGTPSWKAVDAQIEKLVRAAEAERKK